MRLGQAPGKLNLFIENGGVSKTKRKCDRNPRQFKDSGSVFAAMLFRARRNPGDSAKAVHGNGPADILQNQPPPNPRLEKAGEFWKKAG